ncbi:N-acetyltransferase-domain-containing protein [Yamadazyma tenuis]|uniref:N-acetyltransferase-domain-containing protein n=1 Tax=Candida tenuis TaxID=2315449 RepID=UPI0027A4B544|nr:N-acetyltransferase-domain-containing protein [Yamadazyma tenuis]
MEFDESDTALMQRVAEKVGQAVADVFPSVMVIGSEKAFLRVEAAHQLTASDLAPFLSLIGTTIGTLYCQNNGQHWKQEKIVEMKETGLVYVAYMLGDRIIGFISIMLVVDCGEKALYLYEIHIDPDFQDNKLGSKLMGKLHQLSLHLDAQEDDELSSKRTSLTTLPKTEDSEAANL